MPITYHHQRCWLEEDVAYRVLSAGNVPAHRTIAEFRQQHLAAFEARFVQVVRVAREAGVVHLGTLAIDGSKVPANASKHKAMSYGRLRDKETRLREQIAALTAQALPSDAAEDAAHGPDIRGDELHRSGSWDHGSSACRERTGSRSGPQGTRRYTEH